MRLTRLPIARERDAWRGTRASVLALAFMVSVAASRAPGDLGAQPIQTVTCKLNKSGSGGWMPRSVALRIDDKGVPQVQWDVEHQPQKLRPSVRIANDKKLVVAWQHRVRSAEGQPKVLRYLAQWDRVTDRFALEVATGDNTSRRFGRGTCW